MDGQRKQAIQTTFDTVAPGYEQPATAFFARTAERMLDQLALAPNARLLDVCTGTGMVSLRAAAALTDGTVTGVDLSAGMLAQARNRAQALGLGNIAFRQMDMEALAFDAGEFDAATCSFGLFFVDDMAPCLRGIARTVRPGGQVAISTFAGNAFEPMSSLFLRRIEAFGVETRPASWLRLSTESALRELFAAAGLPEVSVRLEPLGYPISVDDWWDIVWNAGYRGYLQALSEAGLAAFRQQHLAEVEAQFAGRGGGWLDVGTMIAVAAVA